MDRLANQRHPLSEPLPIIVVGAGWAGLSCAFRLSEGGHQVILLEGSPCAGGRARTIPFQGDKVDNGQHLLTGAYHQTVALLQALSIPEGQFFSRAPLDLCLHRPCGRRLHLMPNRPGASQGLSLGEKWALRRFFKKLGLQNNSGWEALANQDLSMQVLLQKLKQPPLLIKDFWEPLSLAALTTPLENASAQVFLHTLKTLFSADPKDAAWLFPTKDLSQTLPQAILARLSQKKMAIHYQTPVQGLLIQENRCIGVQTREQPWQGAAVVLAAPPQEVVRLVNPHPALHPLESRLAQFTHQPILTIYLRYQEPPALSPPLIGFSGPLSYWIFDRRLTLQPHLLSVVISGEGTHLTWDAKDLVKKILNDLSHHYPHLAQPLDYKIVREKRAAFSCVTGINQIRPEAQTELKGLYLAGDYTNTGFPATLEGAVASGAAAAEAISKHSTGQGQSYSTLSL